MPIKVIIKSGITPECKKSIELIDAFDADAIFTDKAYVTHKIIEDIHLKKAQAVTPLKTNCEKPRVFDRFLCRYKHLAENAFEKLRRYRVCSITCR